MKTKLDAVVQLEKYDHCFLTPEGVRMIGEPFGFFGNSPAVVNSREFKGLTVEGKEDGEIVDGMDAADLATELCKTESIEYPLMYGRGSQLRICCIALRKHLTK